MSSLMVDIAVLEVWNTQQAWMGKARDYTRMHPHTPCQKHTCGMSHT